MAIKDDFQFHVFDVNNNYLGNIPNSCIDGSFKITVSQKVNSFNPDVTIPLNSDFDYVENNLDVSKRRTIQVRLGDRCVYWGIVDTRQTDLSNKKKIVLNCLAAHELNRLQYKTSSYGLDNNTLVVADDTRTVSEWIGNILGNHELRRNAIGDVPRVLFYTNSGQNPTIKATIGSVTRNLTGKTHREAIKDVMDFCETHYWFIDYVFDDSYSAKFKIFFYLEPYPTSLTDAKHLLTIGKHILKGEPSKKMPDYNVVHFTNEKKSDDVDYIEVCYKNTASVANYGAMVFYMKDPQVTTEEMAQRKATAFLAKHAKPGYYYEKLTLNANEPIYTVDASENTKILGSDLKIGTVINIRNHNDENNILFPDCLVIKGITHDIVSGTVDIELGDVTTSSDFFDLLDNDNMKNRVQYLFTAPNTPTSLVIKDEGGNTLSSYTAGQLTLLNDSLSASTVQLDSLASNQKILTGIANYNKINSNHVTTGELITLSAQIKDAIITSAKINDITASKITSGTIGTQTIILDGVNSVLRSSNYVANTSGWRVLGNGNAEFNNATFRGTVTASTVSASTISGSTISGSTISGNTISGGTISGSTVSGGTISGGLIEGAVYRTDAGNSRIEINGEASDTFTAYDNGTAVARIRGAGYSSYIFHGFSPTRSIYYGNTGAPGAPVASFTHGSSTSTSTGAEIGSYTTSYVTAQSFYNYGSGAGLRAVNYNGTQYKALSVSGESLFDGEALFRANAGFYYNVYIDENLNVGYGIGVHGSGVYFTGIGSATGTDLVISSGGLVYRKSSSRRYKKNIKKLSKDTERILDLNVKEFVWKTNGERDFGIIAEDAFEKAPFVVNVDKKGKPESINTTRFLCSMFNELKKLYKRVKTLEEKSYNGTHQSSY